MSAGARTAGLLARVEQIDAALDRAGDAVPPVTAEAVHRVLAGVRERLELGVDHTVVALAGGTGSGKSSLFNALSGLSFADVGVRRPTTSQVTACVWAHDASALLDWLGVARDRRIERESALDGESQADLRGLVLLDLPDHDSVEPEHRAVVDRLLPLADLLVWVVDPQKYADDALHTRYLRNLVGHEATMLVVLNQVDGVPDGGRAELLADVDRLLREDGLTDVGVHGVSARTGEGLPSLRAALAEAVAARGVAELRAAAEIADAARALAGAVGPGEPDQLPVDTAAAGLGQAVGLPEAVDSVRAAVRSRPDPGWGPPQGERVERVRDAWVAAAAGALPRPWLDAVDGAVPPVEELVAAAARAAEGVPVPPVETRGRTVARAAAAVVGAGAAVLAGLAVGSLAGSGRWTDTASLLVGLAVGGVVLCLLLLAAARAARRRAADRRAQAYDDAVRTALRSVVTERLESPAREVLAAHAAVRAAAVADRAVTAGASSRAPSSSDV